MSSDRVIDTKKYSEALGCDFTFFMKEYYLQPLLGNVLYGGKIPRGILSLYAHLDEDEIIKVIDFCVKNDMHPHSWSNSFKKLIRIDNPRGKIESISEINLVVIYANMMLFDEVPNLCKQVYLIEDGLYECVVGLHRKIYTDEKDYTAILKSLKEHKWQGLVSEKTWNGILETKWLDELE